MVFRVLRTFADRGRIHRFQAAGDTHLIQIRVSDERQQTAVLILPAEPAHASLPRRFEDRDLDYLALDQAATLRGLALRDRDQRIVVDRLDESVTQRVEHGTQCADIFRFRHVLLRLRANRAVIDQRSSSNAILAVIDDDGWIHEGSAVVAMSDADLGDLTRSAADRILVTANAGGRIE